jgi:hypothetical protein
MAKVFGMLQKKNVFSVMERLKAKFVAVLVPLVLILVMQDLHIVFLPGVM